MGMNVKAIERKIAYLGKEGGKDQYMYVMQPLIYNKLTPEKVIQQAALHCGYRGSLRSGTGSGHHAFRSACQCGEVGRGCEHQAHHPATRNL